MSDRASEDEAAQRPEPHDGLQGIPEALRSLWRALARLWPPRVLARWEAEAERVRARRSLATGGRRRWWARTLSTGLVIFAGCFLGALVIDLVAPFGFDDATKAHSRRITGNVFAPFYESAAQDRIAVVLINEAALEARGEAWPPRYSYYESVLRRILWQSPRSVYLDILTSDRRPYDDTLEAARAGITADLEAAGVPLFLGIVPESDGSVFAGAPGISTAFAGWQGFGDHYPLLMHGSVPGASAASVAYALYREACLGDDPICDPDVPPLEGDEAGQPMSLVWGRARPAVAPAIAPWMGECVQAGARADSPWTRLAASGRTAFDELRSGLDPQRLDARRERCPPILTLQEHQLDDPDLAALLEDRVVLIGTQLAALDDSVLSPVHRRLPGVYLHAMALDNLMTYGSDRLREDKWRQRGFGLLLALAASIAIAATWRVYGGLRRRLVLLAVAAGAIACSFLVQFIGRLPAFDWIGTTTLFLLVLFAVSRNYANESGGTQ